MGDLLTIKIKLPTIDADDAKGIEEQIIAYATGFYGSLEGLQLPTEYTARRPRNAGGKKWEVVDLFVEPSTQATRSLTRKLDPGEIEGGTAAEINSKIQQLSDEFFGPGAATTPWGDDQPYELEAEPTTVSDTGWKLSADAELKYTVGLVIRHSTEWPEKPTTED